MRRVKVRYFTSKYGVNKYTSARGESLWRRIEKDKKCWVDRKDRPRILGVFSQLRYRRVGDKDLVEVPYLGWRKLRIPPKHLWLDKGL